MSTTQIDRLRALLEPLAASSGLDLEEVKVTQAYSRRQVQVDVDADGGVDLDTIAEFSRVVGEALDGSDVMGSGAYVLEVGSPGAERTLTEPRHWRRAEGRLRSRRSWRTAPRSSPGCCRPTRTARWSRCSR